ncbi:MAG: WYL domain-containing protein [Paludibacter sp.]|nr:WYL domain-containing protein [Paludibacter sp.]
MAKEITRISELIYDLEYRQEILSMGEDVMILEPVSFREELIELNKRILKNYNQ